MKLRSILFSVFVLAALIAQGAAARAAATPETLGKFGYWMAYKMTENGQPVCYMSITSRPPPSKDKKLKRGDVVLMITHRPADNSTDVVSYTAGLKFKPSSEVVITAGAKKFNLFTQSDTAWSRDSATDHALATALRNNASLTINGLTARETAIADKFSLKGSFDAYAAINKACGMPVPEAPKASKPAPAKTTKKKKS